MPRSVGPCARAHRGFLVEKNRLLHALSVLLVRCFLVVTAPCRFLVYFVYVVVAAVIPVASTAPAAHLWGSPLFWVGGGSCTSRLPAARS